MPITEEREKSIYQAAAKETWFHAIELGEYRTSGRFPEGTPQNMTLYGVMELLKNVDVKGMRCLDIGTASGISSFNMASRGGVVVATDIYTSKNRGFALAQEYLDLDIDYREKIGFANILDHLPRHSFDVVVCAGVLYHMLNPFDSILKCRELLKRDGILIFESAFLDNTPGAYIDFNPVSQSMKEVYTYWMPTKDAMLGMLRFAGFNILAIRSVLSPGRIAFVAQSGDLADVQDRPDMMKRLHDTGISDSTFPSPPPATPVSKATYSGASGDTIIDWKSYKPDFFPHPSNALPALGKTAWINKNRNF